MLDTISIFVFERNITESPMEDLIPLKVLIRLSDRALTANDLHSPRLAGTS